MKRVKRFYKEAQRNRVCKKHELIELVRDVAAKAFVNHALPRPTVQIIEATLSSRTRHRLPFALFRENLILCDGFGNHSTLICDVDTLNPSSLEDLVLHIVNIINKNGLDGFGEM
ncbi:unnamed protein product [Toxocara canis]|uniref:Auxilin-like protein n=1 Tax=Toxocara canis TaxID=6265 RepID=A0A183TXF6_TOXCA|nr:unnamed protein product [Toxocara canis]